ncbi:hypothetical protein O6H91_04G064700 [Diphasiastrum complanatum]|uniref:Uncharacterized protein n=1 Tax=Diphasiastrum complanatum TaxID=34168 RepID=A0ACC2DYB5_DIPCM|nr:hypothetical protein O6H91_04G064700 [Diphasiastrum complanatum]
MDNLMSRRWWSKETVALVTGANKGIGFAIVKQLAKEGLTAILTSRDIQNGQKACDMLREEGLNVLFHQLDVTDLDSIIRVADWVKTQFGGIDILINNAGVNFRTTPLSLDGMEVAHSTLETNYYGVKRVTEAMLSLFRLSTQGNRIVNVSSMMGQLSVFQDETWKTQLSSVDTLTEELIESFLQNCLVKIAKNLNTKVPGLEVFKAELHYPKGLIYYGLSKAALNAYSRMLARDLSKRSADQMFYVSCMCPGLTSTDMTGNVGHTPEEGADTAVWLALLPASECSTGNFFIKRQERSFEYIEEVFSLSSHQALLSLEN